MDKKARRDQARGRLEVWANVPAMIRVLQDEADGYAAEVEQLLAPTPTAYDRQPGGSGPGDPTAAMAARHERYLSWARRQVGCINRRMAAYQQYAAEVDRCVALLPSLECRVVLLRYRDYAGARSGYWGKIARRLHISEDYAKQLERQALDRLGDRLPELPEKVPTISHC